MNNRLARGLPIAAAPPLCLRPAEAARELGISPSTLERLTKAGEIRCIKLNRAKIYPRDELCRWVSSRVNAARAPEVNVRDHHPSPSSIGVTPAYTIHKGYYDESLE